MSSFSNGPGSWRALERALSGKPLPARAERDESPTSRKREGYVRPADLVGRAVAGAEVTDRVPYAELHCHSNFSFLDGASDPEVLVEEAARLRLDAIAITDHDGMYGVVRFAEAAKDLGLRTVFGAELSVGLSVPQAGEPDPESEHVLLLARSPEGYRRLCRVITAAQLRAGEKGRPTYDWDEVVEETREHCILLTGCRKGRVRQTLDATLTTAGDVGSGQADAARHLQGLVDAWGREQVVVELTAHGHPLDSRRNDILAGIAADAGLLTIATNAVHYARPRDFPLAAAVAAVRARRSLTEMDGWLPPAGTAHLRSGPEMAALLARYPGAVQRAAVLGVECAFELDLLAPKLPPFPCPDGHDETSFLRLLVEQGAQRRYGTRHDNPRAYAQLDHELDIITQLGFRAISSSCGTSSGSAASKTSSAKGEGLRPTPRSATRWASSTPTRCAGTYSSNAS